MLALDANRLTLSLAKMERRSSLSSASREAFLNLNTRSASFAAQRELVREGDRTDACLFLESGVVSGSKMLPNGGRQIVVFHFAGDMLGLASSLLLVADNTLRAHSSAVVLSVAAADILRLAQEFPEIGRAFWFDTLVDASIFREWNLNVGRRGARERLAHLLLEMGCKSEAALIDDKADFAFPITQTDLADALGLTPVHVNRSMQWLRGQGYVRNFGKRMIIRNWEGLSAFAAFRPLYLHPEGPRELAH
jgi:CRP-like cAMP-binding protein